MAEERKDERDVVAAAHAGVERLSRRYRELLQSLSPGEQMKADRALGRRVVDLKRLASLLPKVPAAVTPESTPDRVAGGGAPEDRRITGVSWSHDRRGPRRQARASARTSSPGAASCGESTTHSIVAMVGAASRSRSSVRCAGRATRTAPDPRGRSRPAPPRPPRRTIARAPSIPRRKRGRRSCARSARRSPPRRDVRVFDPKERYKTGRDHRPPRVRPREDRERAALEPAGPLPDRRPQVADARLRLAAALRRVDLVEEPLQQAVDHQVAAGGVVAAGAVAALRLLEPGAGLGDQGPVGADLAR